ncbi:hypothetical protein H0H87_003637 [Tephrocybe sp. NHM501043]|nr:hypothetical protein H0H87_003637 [Tephrocybe sp. NHM501043]
MCAIFLASGDDQLNLPGSTSQFDYHTDYRNRRQFLERFIGEPAYTSLIRYWFDNLYKEVLLSKWSNEEGEDINIDTDEIEDTMMQAFIGQVHAQETNLSDFDSSDTDVHLIDLGSDVMVDISMLDYVESQPISFVPTPISYTFNTVESQPCHSTSISTDPSISTQAQASAQSIPSNSSTSSISLMVPGIHTHSRPAVISAQAPAFIENNAHVESGEASVVNDHRVDQELVDGIWAVSIADPGEVPIA